MFVGSSLHNNVCKLILYNYSSAVSAGSDGILFVTAAVTTLDCSTTMCVSIV